MAGESSRAGALSAGSILACAGAGGHLAGSAADGWFLAAVGPAHLGAAVAGSSFLVAITLALVGALADRRDRRRTLVGLAGGGAVLLAAAALAHDQAPRATAIAAFVATKQIQAAVELGFWVAISEWFDARAIRRLVPRLAAAGGLGAAVGAGLAIPLARLGGAPAVMIAGAFAFALAGCAAGFAPTARRLGAGLAVAPRGRWLDGLLGLRRHPLAIGLAIVVAIAGGFASIAYVTLGAAAAARHADAGALAGFLASVRMIGQLTMILAQLAIAPRLIARLGVGGALVVPPIAALAGGLGLLGGGGLTAAAALQVQARITDGAIEGPAEKLALNLLPAELRGRLGGWLEGPAKRTGAIAGGLAATAAMGAPGALAVVAVAVAIAWLAAAWWVRTRLPRWALGALVGAPDEPEPGEVALGERAARAIVAEVAALDGVRAAEVAARLHRAGGFDARPGLIARLAGGQIGAARAATVAALTRLHKPGDRNPALAAALAALPRTDDAAGDAAIVGLAGRLGRAHPLAIADDERGGPRAAIAIARARGRGDGAAIAAAIDDALDDDATRALATGELAAEVVDLTAAADREAFAIGRRLLRAIRRGGELPPAVRAHGLAALGALAASPRADAEALLIRTDARELVRTLAGASHPPPPPAVAAAAIAALARWPGPIGDDDLALLADALGDRDDAIRAAAEDGLRTLGAQPIVALVRAAGLGRRAARDRAVALLGELAVSAGEVAALVGAELDELDRVAVHAATLTQLGDRWLDRRQDERLAEIGHTALLLVAAQTGARAIARAARQLRAAHSLAERARAVELLDAALPRAVATRLIPILDPGELAARVHGARARAGRVLDLDATIAAELTGRDALTRDLLVRALGPERRARFRAALGAAARAAAGEINPLDLLRRVTTDDHDDDVPPAVDVMLVLAELPALAGLSTPQLAAVTARGDTVAVDAGATVSGEGERLDALIVVLDGQLRCGERTIGRGQAVDELAPLAPRPSPAVVATAPARIFRLRRLALDELVDDEPGLGAALLRYLAERLR